VERLCDRLVVIDRGRVISDGTVAQIKQTYGRTRTLVVDFVEPQAPITLESITGVRIDGPRQWLSFDRTTSAAQLIAEGEDRG